MNVSKAWVTPVIGLGAWLAFSASAGAQTTVSCTLSGTPPNITLTCGSGAPTGGGSTGPTCTDIQLSNPSPGSSGGAVSLTAVCSGAATWNWRSTGASLSTTSTSTATNSGTYPNNSSGTQTISVTFYVSGCANGSCGPEIQKVVNVPAGSSGGGTTTGGGTGFCANYQNVSQVSMSSWNAGFIQTVQQHGVIVVPFTPAVGQPGISYGNYSGSPIWRTVTISTSACDFRTTIDPTGANGPIAGMGGGIGYLAPTLNPGQQYYINVGDLVWSTGAGVCKTTNCGDILMTIQ